MKDNEREKAAAEKNAKRLAAKEKRVNITDEVANCTPASRY